MSEEDPAVASVELSVEHVLAAEPGVPCAVVGYVVVSDGVGTVSDELAESFPPQPGGSWLLLEETERAVRLTTESHDHSEWTARPVRIVGRRRGNAFVIDDFNGPPSVGAGQIDE